MESTMTEETKQTKVVKSDDTTNEKTPQTGAKLAWLPGLLAVAAIGVSAYAWQQAQSLNTKVSQLTQQNQQLHSATQQGLSQSRVDVRGFQQDISNLQSAIKEASAEREALSGQIVSVKGKSQSSRDGWQLLEAQYLIHLADYNLKFMHNVPQALHLLQAADRQLKSLSQPHLVRVRRAIAKDISTLKAYPQVDKAGMLSQLDALRLASQKLALRTPKKPSDIKKSFDEKESTDNNSQPSKWKKAWGHSLKTLQKIVVIRHQQKPMQALMGPEQHQFLLHAIAYQLQQAQWALLNRDELVFQQSLKQVMSTVSENFDSEKKSSSAFVAQLNALAKTEIGGKVPDVADSLMAVTDALKTGGQKKGVR